MSLARSITKRYRKDDNTSPATPTHLGRSGTIKKYDGLIDRSRISLPLELLSTTNVHIHSHPDISTLNSPLHVDSRSSSGSSSNSFQESERSPGYHSSSSISSPETQSLASSPSSPAPNHLSTYFQAPSTAIEISSDADKTPDIPSRAMSHTKKSHQAVARQRSRSQIRSPLPRESMSSTSARSDTRTSVDMFHPTKPDSTHPFGAELAQLNEVMEMTEEIAGNGVMVWDEEEKYLAEHGLFKFAAHDYMMEIQGLNGGYIDERAYPIEAEWI